MSEQQRASSKVSSSLTELLICLKLRNSSPSELDRSPSAQKIELESLSTAEIRCKLVPEFADGALILKLLPKYKLVCK